MTLSIGTLAVLLTVWWTVATLQLISPLFLPPPQQVLEKLLTIAGPQGFMDATLWQHLAASLTRIMLALFAAVLFGIPVGIAMGLSPTVRGILDPSEKRFRRQQPVRHRLSPVPHRKVLCSFLWYDRIRRSVSVQYYGK